MKLCRAVAAVALIATGALALHTALAEEAAITRTDLQQEDLSIPGRAVVQVLVEFAPGASFPLHAHPGEEIVYVTEGALEYALEGQEPVTLQAGEVLFIPYGVAHAVRNVGDGPAAELATYIVEKDKTLLEIVE